MFSQGARAGFEAWIATTKDKKRLNFHQEHHASPAETKDEGSSEAYVECEMGSEFSINVRALEVARTKEWTVRIYINGDQIKDEACPLGTRRIICREVYEEHEGKMYSRPLRFAMPTCGLNPGQLGKELPKDFGTISVVITGGKLSDPREDQSADVCPLTVITDEKAIKVAATIDVGEKTLFEGSMIEYDWAPDPNQKVFYRYTWKYRTLEKLRVMGIIKDDSEVPPSPVIARKRPRPPTPPLEESALFEIDKKPDMSSLIAQLQYTQAELRKANERIKNGLEGKEREVIDLTQE